MAETTPTPRPKTKPDPEFSAMRRILGILRPLSVPARRRVLAYAAERVETDPPAGPKTDPGGPLQGSVGSASWNPPRTEPLLAHAAQAAGGLLG